MKVLSKRNVEINSFVLMKKPSFYEKFGNQYLAHVIEQPIFLIPNLKYLQRNLCFDFFNDSDNTF